jgi:DnaJ-class molecular chaperone
MPLGSRTSCTRCDGSGFCIREIRGLLVPKMTAVVRCDVCSGAGSIDDRRDARTARVTARLITHPARA